MLIVTLTTVAVVASPIPSAPIALAATVLASRLMPFVSFDMISYAAGLSRLHAWRFALATLAGIIPASFLPAHFGGEAVSGDLGRATWAVLGLGLVTGVPLIWAAARGKAERKRCGPTISEERPVALRHSGNGNRRDDRCSHHSAQEERDEPTS